MKKIFLLLVIFVYQQVFPQGQQYLIKTVNISDSSSNFGLSFCMDDFVIFSSPTKDENLKIRNKKKKKAHPKSLDFFFGYADEQGNINNVKELSKGINSFFDEIDIAFSPNHKTVYFTRSTSSDGSKKHLELYKADVVTIGFWKNIIKMPFNSLNYSVSNPVVSPDGKELYFASNMPSSKGGFDIYKVAIFENNKFGEPINLGNTINTVKDEVTPFVTSEKLFFSSNGHKGEGGLDVFVTRFDNIDEVINIGTPINSAENDYYYKEKRNSNIGYFTSNRTTGSGNDDIYFFKDITKIEEVVKEEFEKPKEVVKKTEDKIITKKDSDFELRKERLLAKKDIIIVKTANNSISVKEDKISKIEILKEKQYKALIEKEEEKIRTTIKINNTVVKSNNMDIERSKNKHVIDDFERCQTLFDALNSVYFDYNEYYITPESANELNRVIQIMRRCPKIIVLASSHTDSRAGYDYNMELSRKRANEVMDYIIRNGKFSENRIRSIGFGEARLLNKCSDGVKCTERQHQVNRRTEFEIANY